MDQRDTALPVPRSLRPCGLEDRVLVLARGRAPTTARRSRERTQRQSWRGGAGRSEVSVMQMTRFRTTTRHLELCLSVRRGDRESKREEMVERENERDRVIERDNKGGITWDKL